MFDFLSNNKKEIEDVDSEEVESIDEDYKILSSEELSDIVSKKRLHTRFTFEIAGSPKDHVEKALKLYVDKIYESEILKFSKVDFLDTEEDDKVFIKIVEIEGVIDKEKLGDFIISFLPSYFELISPSSVKVDAQELMNLFNGLISKLHQNEMSKKNLSSEHKLLRKKFSTLNKNTDALMKNFMKYILKDEGKDIKELSKIIGMTEPHLEKVLKSLISKGELKKSKEKYMIK